MSAVSILGFLLPYWVSPAPARAEVAPVVVAPASITMNEGGIISFRVTASDPDGDPIASLTAAPLPPGASLTTGAPFTSGVFGWGLNFNQAGEYDITFTATSGIPALSGSVTTHIVVTDVDRAPVVTAPASVSVSANTLLTINVTVADPDGDAIASLTASPLPSGATFTSGPGDTSGTLTWTPTAAQAGNYTITFTAANARSGTSATAVAVLLGADNAPVVTAPKTNTVNGGAVVTINVSAIDQDGDAITSLTGEVYAGSTQVTEGVNFMAGPDYTSGTLTWKSFSGTAGSSDYTARFTASNALSGTSITTITVVSHSPVFDPDPIPDIIIAAGDSVDQPFTVRDEDLDPLTVYSPQTPISIHPTVDLPGLFQGKVQWTPDATFYGTAVIIDVCANESNIADFNLVCKIFMVTILPLPNHPPVLAADPHVPSTVTVRYGETLRLPFVFTDEDNDVVSCCHFLGEQFGDLNNPNIPAHIEDVVSIPGRYSGTLVWTPQEIDGGIEGEIEAFCANDGHIHIGGDTCVYLLLYVPEIPSPLHPVAVLTVSPTEVCTGDPVTFDLTGSYDPDGTLTHVFGNFGDGEPYGAAVPGGLLATHAFSAPGTYTSNFAVFDDYPVLGNGSTVVYGPPVVVSDPVNGLPPGLPTNEYLMLIPFNPSDPLQALAEIMIQGFISQNGNFDPANVDLTPENTSLRFTDDLGVVHEIHPAAVIPEPANGRVVFFFFPPDPQQFFATLGHDTTVTLRLEGRLNNVSGCNRIQSDFPFRVIRNHVPSITPVPDRTIYRDETLTFTATATDPDNDPLTFSMDDVFNDFPGANLDPITGVFTWQPGPDSLGTHGPLELCVVDHHNQGEGVFGCTSFEVTVLNRPPVAVANITTPAPLCVGKPVQFDGTDSHDPDGTIVSQSWAFGDGTPAVTTSLTPKHKYRNTGTYTTELTVTDNGTPQLSDTDYTVVKVVARRVELGGITNMVYDEDTHHLEGPVPITFGPGTTGGWLFEQLNAESIELSAPALGNTTIQPTPVSVAHLKNKTGSSFQNVFFSGADLELLLNSLPNSSVPFPGSDVTFKMTGSLTTDVGCDRIEGTFTIPVFKR